uniref:hypothetical protein n=1 Tax=Shewanella sp. T24-MNA-CIBAN-0130 TaxID=3140470 RepID=UPI00332973E0
ECNLFHGAMMIPFGTKSSIFNDHGYMLSPSSVMPKEAVATATDSTAADVITNAINIEPTTALNPANEN